jgi:hypothetical protein
VEGLIDWVGGRRGWDGMGGSASDEERKVRWLGSELQSSELVAVGAQRGPLKCTRFPNEGVFLEGSAKVFMHVLASEAEITRSNAKGKR